MNVFETRESEVRAYCRAYPAVFATASNATMTDEQGRSWIDFFAGAGVLNFGHNHPRMKTALVEHIQADGVAHSLDLHTTAKRHFMERFTETILRPRDMPHRMQFTGPTGTNAVEAALKLARLKTGRRTVVAFTGGFHGMTHAALAATGNQHPRSGAGAPLNDIVRAPFDGDLGPDVDTVGVMRRMLEDPSGGLEAPAAFLVEPLQAEGGVNVASAAWLHKLQGLARDVGALLILDDIQAGCGRTGHYFSFDGMDLDPDLVVLAKGLGGFGTPIGMVLIKPEHDVWKPGHHTGTFRGPGLSFVAGAVGLDILDEEGFYGDVRAKGSRMRQALDDMASRHAAFSVRGKGMMQGLDVVDGMTARRIVAHAWDRGLLVSSCGRHGAVIKCIPPLTIEEAHLEQGLSILSDAVDATLAEAA